jgi:hypothetical protein
MKLVTITLSAHLTSFLLLLRQRRVAAGNGLGTGLDITSKYVRRTASGAAGNGHGTTAKYLLRLQIAFSGNGLGNTIKYLNICRGQPPGNHDQVPAWRRGHRPGHHD